MRGRQANPESLMRKVEAFIHFKENIVFDDVVKEFPDKPPNTLKVYWSMFRNKEGTHEKKKRANPDRHENVEFEDVPSNTLASNVKNAGALTVESSCKTAEDIIEEMRLVRTVDPKVIEMVVPERVIDVFKVSDTAIFHVGEKYIKTARCICCRAVVATLDVTKEVNMVIKKRQVNGDSVDENVS